MSGITQNVSRLNQKQVLKLMENNGLGANGVEYCLESLSNRLVELKEKAAAKYENSREAILAELNANIQFPPKIKKIKKNVENPVEKSGFKLSLHGERSLLAKSVSKIKFEVRY